ncbi:MFS transporter, MCP family, solute carrier family 16, member 6 [Aaosphaeria arxii CBS 175.79]|uniref:MFS transporter, MCP family, solute carrier family 16, member 6 n=1 Tax=Aaosphaeria arxii CBS 175.79 TaxID=1450172 RepID=A0A6A5XBZ7_9PLEO|nr:MFS transporter, MCP family, solute carrier family 16, member 6 [Aaosphaeria arxii CBS 175.79]KAF2010440.1 MFS transporter, MCP family, solute carrier family 16, member 6 [Aaosphaeria arxii CBS 175.79]
MTDKQIEGLIAPKTGELVVPAVVEESNEHQIPDGGYGWVCVACVTTVNSFTWGVFGSYGVYLAYYLANDIYPEATPLDYAYIGGLNFGVAMIMASPVTYLVRIFGTHIPMAVGALIQMGGYIAASFSTRIWHLYCTQGILLGIGVGFLFTPSVAVTSQWFDKKRSLANSINSAGTGIGGLIISFSTQPMIDRLSLAWSLRIIGIMAGTMNLLATCFIRNRNKVIQPTMNPFAFHLLRRLPVILLLCWGFFSMLGYMVLLYSLSDFARSIGLSKSQASSVTALMNLGTLIGRPALGVLSDRYGRMKVAGIATFACGVAIWALWVPAASYAVTVVFALINGMVAGTYWMALSPLCVEVGGLIELPSLLALSFGTAILPTTFAMVIALNIKKPDADKPYLYPQVFTGLAYLAASAFMLALWLIQRRKKLVSI